VLVQRWIYHTSPTDPCSSPARKRQRFSSPFEEYFEEPSQDDLAALDRLEEKLLLQGSKHVDNLGDKENLALISTAREHSNSPVKGFSSPSRDHHFRSSQTISDSDNPFIAQMPSFTSANHLNAPSGFTSALHISASGRSQDERRSSSPDRPPEDDYTSWFAPAAIPAVAQFQSAKISVASSLSSPRPEPIPAAAAGFMKASKKGWAMPSHTALLQAEEKMKKIWAEGEADGVSSFAAAVPAHPGVAESAVDINKDFDSSSCIVESQTPAGFGRPSIADDASLSTITANFEHFKRNAKPFKSPLMTAFHSTGPKSSLYASSPLNPKSQSAKSFVSVGSHQPHLATPSGFPLLSLKAHDSAFVTPVRPQAAKRRVMSDTPTKSKFVTPFKIGMRPGEPGHERLVDSNKKGVALATMSAINSPTLSNSEKVKTDGHGTRKQVFDLSRQQYPEFAF
jgi:breast cancer 2 susceptibility protein